MAKTKKPAKDSARASSSSTSKAAKTSKTKRATKGARKTTSAGEQEVEIDRREAIRRAIMYADVDDVILVAGKGHEDYQDIEGVRHPFSDVEIVREVLSERGGLAR